MLLRQLANTGVMLPEVGVGMWQYRGGVEPVRHAIGLGAFLIDTAESYGTEPITGEAVRGLREKVFLATKVSGEHLHAKDVVRSADASLKKLGTDVIDLYQVHWPNSRIPIAETMGALEDLVDRGKVRFIGVSNFSVEEMEAARKALKKHPLTVNQVLYNLEARGIEQDVLPYCQKNNITVLAYSPLARGALLRTGPRGRTEPLLQVAKELGKTPAQLALNWCLAHPGVIVIPKSDRAERWDENVGASGWQLSAAHRRSLEEAFPL